MGDLEYKGVWTRFGPIVVDQLIIGFISGFIVGVFIWLFNLGLTTSGERAVLYPTYLFSFMLYTTVMEGTKGQTLGKMISSIEVVKEDGSPCDMTSSFIRNIMRLVDWIVFYIVGVISIAVTDKSQRLGDLAAGTLVVKKKEEKKVRSPRSSGSGVNYCPACGTEVVDMSYCPDCGEKIE